MLTSPSSGSASFAVAGRAVSMAGHVVHRQKGPLPAVRHRGRGVPAKTPRWTIDQSTLANLVHSARARTGVAFCHPTANSAEAREPEATRNDQPQRFGAMSRNSDRALRRA